MTEDADEIAALQAYYVVKSELEMHFGPAFDRTTTTAAKSVVRRLDALRTPSPANPVDGVEEGGKLQTLPPELAADYTPDPSLIAAEKQRLSEQLTALQAQSVNTVALADYARKASIALSGLSGGGSEMFTRIGDEFYAEPDTCVQRVLEKQANRERLSQPVEADGWRSLLKEAQETVRRLKRTGEMSAGIMRDARRTGAWEGAEKTARQFERMAESAANILTKIDAFLSTTAQPEREQQESDK